MELKDRILAADDRPFQDEEIPEWDNVKIRVRGLTGTERDSYEAKAVALRNAGKDVELRLQNFRSRLLVKCLYDPETGERIFADGEVDQLGSKSGAVIERLFTLAQELSGMDAEARERAKGNSESAQNESSTSV